MATHRKKKPAIPHDQADKPDSNLRLSISTELLSEIQSFVQKTLYWTQNSANLPLTQEEQVIFIRSTLFLADKISKQEEWLKLAVFYTTIKRAQLGIG